MHGMDSRQVSQNISNHTYETSERSYCMSTVYSMDSELEEQACQLHLFKKTGRSDQYDDKPLCMIQTERLGE